MASLGQRWFGRGKEAGSSSNADVLTQIADSKDLIEKRQAHLTRKVEAHIQEACAHKAAGRKDQALACLKRKKLIDEELTGLVQQTLKLDSQEHALQSLHFQQQTLAVEKNATAAIKRQVGATVRRCSERAQLDLQRIRAAIDADAELKAEVHSMLADAFTAMEDSVRNHVAEFMPGGSCC